jgi:hypothetical protein
MAVKKYKPVTPSLRGMSGHTFNEITKTEPERSLVVSRKRKGVRYGRVTFVTGVKPSVYPPELISSDSMVFGSKAALIRSNRTAVWLCYIM